MPLCLVREFGRHFSSTPSFLSEHFANIQSRFQRSGYFARDLALLHKFVQNAADIPSVPQTVSLDSCLQPAAVDEITGEEHRTNSVSLGLLG